MASKNSPLETKFSFNLLPNKTFSFLQDKTTLQLLMKWSMLGRISAQAFSFDQTFYPYNSHDFTLSFFRDPCVLTNLRKMEAGAWVTLATHRTLTEQRLLLGYGNSTWTNHTQNCSTP
eukprot:XP_014039054.1 PREDICTED: uncharacterized protein C11orf70 homolog [Salmo salar]